MLKLFVIAAIQCPADFQSGGGGVRSRCLVELTEERYAGYS